MKTIINSIGNETKIFAETFEYEAYDQVKALANFEPYLNEKIRVMPDAHVGKGSTVGTWKGPRFRSAPWGVETTLSR